MALVNFYHQTPDDRQVASDLANDELVVFNHLTTGARELAEKVRLLIDFSFNTHDENTIPKWKGDDYWVMVRGDFAYAAKRQTLRALAVDWINAGCPDQVKHI